MITSIDHKQHRPMISALKSANWFTSIPSIPHCTIVTMLQSPNNIVAVAKRHGWAIVGEYSDRGISRTKGKDHRPAFKAVRQAVARKELDLVAAWSVDSLSRSLRNLVNFLGELHAKHVDLYLHQQGLDTGTTAGKEMFRMMGVSAEFERDMGYRLWRGQGWPESRQGRGRNLGSSSGECCCGGSGGGTMEARAGYESESARTGHRELHRSTHRSRVSAGRH